MVREIVHDEAFLAQSSAPAGPEDAGVARDLQDTLAAHRAHCVGMAANMIGVRKRIIIFDGGGIPMVMFNPRIVEKSGPYETEEGCLSLSGKRRTRRYASITVSYQNRAFRLRQQQFTGFTAQIIQHEIDHCNGILI